MNILLKGLEIIDNRLITNPSGIRNLLEIVGNGDGDSDGDGAVDEKQSHDDDDDDVDAAAVALQQMEDKMQQQASDMEVLTQKVEQMDATLGSLHNLLAQVLDKLNDKGMGEAADY